MVKTSLLKGQLVSKQIEACLACCLCSLLYQSFEGNGQLSPVKVRESASLAHRVHVGIRVRKCVRVFMVYILPWLGCSRSVIQSSDELLCSECRKSRSQSAQAVSVITLQNICNTETAQRKHLHFQGRETVGLLGITTLSILIRTRSSQRTIRLTPPLFVTRKCLEKTNAQSCLLRWQGLMTPRRHPD